MIRLGLIGFPLSHSLSPQLHAAALKSLGLDGEYLLYPVSPDDKAGLANLTDRLRRGELDGLNVTIPHKQNILPLLDELTPTAQAIGASNTLFMREGRLIGGNTDVPGFLADLEKILSPGTPGKALVFGSGGGARAVVYALLQNGWNVTIAALLMDQAGALVKAFRGAAGKGSARVVPNERAGVEKGLDGVGLIVNASPVGMFPKVDESPWPDGLDFPKGVAVYDLVYNPRQTLFTRQARTAGLSARTGLGMLVEQAALSFECWTGQAPPREAMFASVEA